MHSPCIVVIACLLVVLFGTTTHAIGCKDELGNSVDWWVMAKAPLIPQNADPEVSEGRAYMYADATSNTLVRSGHSLNDNSTGALAFTLSQIYSNAGSDTIGWLMYNDQLPKSTYDTYAHSKGVVAFDAEAGFWLVHSVPRFPLSLSTSSAYYYPEDETENGQSFLCVNYDIATFETVANFFVINKPYVFESNFPSKFESILPTMETVLAKKWNTAPTATTADITSIGGNTFSVFAKNLQWDQDLYEGIVEPTLKSGLFVQSWRDGTPSTLMPTFCTPTYTYDSINILQMTMNDPKAPGVVWSYTKDHSKWAVTMIGNPYICIGDINRMFSQYNRGGGTVCFINKGIWTSYNSSITQTDFC